MRTMLKPAALALAALGAVALPVASPAEAQETAQFSVGGVAFEIVLPDGFCIPTGDAATAAAVLASADTQNVTALSVVTCGADAFEKDYFAIKTPVMMVGTVTTRDEFLKMMEPEFGKPRTDGMFADVTGRAADAVSDRVGERINMTGVIEPLGMDDMCVYFGGIMTVKAEGVDVTGAVGACITVIGGKVMTMNSVGRGSTQADLTRHVRFSRTLAEAIRPRK